jgi:hypothetical protein
MHLHCCSQPWGLATSNGGIALRMSSVDQVRLQGLLEHIVREEWDWALPDSLRLASFASATLDLIGAHNAAQTHLIGLQNSGRKIGHHDILHPMQQPPGGLNAWSV